MSDAGRYDCENGHLSMTGWDNGGPCPKCNPAGPDSVRKTVTGEQIEKFAKAFGDAETAELPWKECIRKGFLAAMEASEDE